jgi:hypothetical protein
MVMPIPPHLPELINLPSQRQEVTTLAPVSPLVGLPDVAQGMDPRLGLQWTPPVFESEVAQTSKDVSQTWPDTQPSAAALLQLDEQPSLGGSAWPLSAWLNAVAMKSKAQGQVLAWPNSLESTAQVDGVALGSDGFNASATMGDSVIWSSMVRLYDTLSASSIFAADRLAQWLQSHPVRPVDDASKNGTTQNTQAKIPNQKDWMEQLSALSPESPHAQQAAQCLTQGAILWSGQFAPGLWATLRRDDAWREQLQMPAQMEKGVALTLETELPHLGRLKIVAQRFATDSSIQLWVQPLTGEPLLRGFAELQENLSRMGIAKIQVLEGAA